MQSTYLRPRRFHCPPPCTHELARRSPYPSCPIQTDIVPAASEEMDFRWHPGSALPTTNYRDRRRNLCQGSLRLRQLLKSKWQLPNQSVAPAVNPTPPNTFRARQNILRVLRVYPLQHKVSEFARGSRRRVEPSSHLYANKIIQQLHEAVDCYLSFFSRFPSMSNSCFCLLNSAEPLPLSLSPSIFSV